MNTNPKYTVVAAVIEDNGEILVVQKPKTRFPYTAFHWEYPGGKVEQGETEPEALARELREEMDYPIRVEERLCVVDYDYPDFSVSLRFYHCYPADQANPRHFILKEHVDFRWLRPSVIVDGSWNPEPQAFCAADYDPLLLAALEKL